jgi:hypothetical protein
MHRQQTVWVDALTLSVASTHSNINQLGTVHRSQLLQLAQHSESAVICGAAHTVCLHIGLQLHVC